MARSRSQNISSQIVFFRSLDWGEEVHRFSPTLNRTGFARVHPEVVGEERGFLIRSALSGVGCWDSPGAVGRGRALRVGSAIPALPKRLRRFTNNIGMRPFRALAEN